jgi:hypothetical protein
MKTPEYTEGPKAQENFERGMKALFKVPKANIVQREKQAKARNFLESQGPAQWIVGAGSPFVVKVGTARSAIKAFLVARPSQSVARGNRNPGTG